MKIWVDADACPNVIKDILCRAADRAQVTATFVANREVSLPPSRFLRAIRVSPGFDVADNAIATAVETGDLVITADIPLAALVVGKGAEALNPRGERYTADNIRQRLTMRNFMEELRSSGVNIGGPASMSQAERQDFANQLDRLLRRHASSGN
ncbi:MAG: YaiI/YqxD family protein [Methylococcaceae bacterium]|nr:YaiI/YqxD family protein [Methylococcaceae bacterium]